MWGFFIDYYYIILVLPAVILTMVAQIWVRSTFNKYNRIGTRSGMTGREASLVIQQRNGMMVPVEMVAGDMTDHYDPRSNTIRLSETVGPVPSIAAIGVAAHETGHAMQYAQEYLPIKIRSALIPITQFASSSAWVLIILGLLFSQTLAIVGILLFGVAVLFQLVTLPVEFNASRRALAALREQDILTQEELAGARKVLTAAAMTYVAALFLSIMQLLRLLLIVTGRGRHD